MGYKLTHIISGNVRSGNWDMIATAPDADGNEWRLNDQRIAARHTEAARHAKHQRDGLAKFREALANIKDE